MTNSSTNDRFFSAHTAGPWEVWKGEAEKEFIIQQKEGRLSVCRLTRPFADSAEANGRLIAAAPELLDALVAVNEWSKLAGDDKTDYPERFVEAAIAKVGG